MTVPANTTSAYWLEAFSGAESLDVLEALFGAWHRDFRSRMSEADGRKVIQAKDTRKAQLKPRRVA